MCSSEDILYAQVYILYDLSMNTFSANLNFWVNNSYNQLENEYVWKV